MTTRYGHVKSPKSLMAADMLKETWALDRYLIGPRRLQLTVTQVVSGFLQSTDNFPSGGCVGFGLAKTVVPTTDLSFFSVSSDFDVLLLSVGSSNCEVLPLSVASSFSAVV